MTKKERSDLRAQVARLNRQIAKQPTRSAWSIELQAARQRLVERLIRSTP